MGFVLHPRLMADTAVIVDWSLSRVLLMNDKRFPWIVLVPRRPNLVELFDLDETSRMQLTTEIARAGERLRSWGRTHGGADKINVGVIGNLVPQLHVHVVARKKGDAVWPGTVWGAGQAEHYGAAELMRVVGELRDAL
jgi:diadenosine tetraphosphate (Ap4A) HIT family hydrolase